MSSCQIASPVAGTRTEPKDSYIFVKGTTVTFKTTFTFEGRPTQVDTNTIPYANVLQPTFLSNGSPTPMVVSTIQGTLVPGQQYEYQFVWNIPQNIQPSDDWIVNYNAYLGGNIMMFGDEFFTIITDPGQIGMLTPSYATVDDVRQKKFNIDDYLPQPLRSDLIGRNNMIMAHLRDATSRLREELALFKQRGNTENYRLFSIYYTVWSILLASRGEDGSAVSDQNILFWRGEWERILAQEKRKSVFQGMPMGRG